MIVECTKKWYHKSIIICTRSFNPFIIHLSTIDKTAVFFKKPYLLNDACLRSKRLICTHFTLPRNSMDASLWKGDFLSYLWPDVQDEFIMFGVMNLLLRIVNHYFDFSIIEGTQLEHVAKNEMLKHKKDRGFSWEHDNVRCTRDFFS